MQNSNCSDFFKWMEQVIITEVADKQRRLVEVDVNFIEEITVSHARRE